jgi:malate synthase
MTKIRDHLGPTYAEGKYEDAERIFAGLVNSDTFVDFLTLPAYELVD